MGCRMFKHFIETYKVFTGYLICLSILSVFNFFVSIYDRVTLVLSSKIIKFDFYDLVWFIPANIIFIVMIFLLPVLTSNLIRDLEISDTKEE